MTKDTSSKRRVMLAITDTGSLQAIWHTALERLTSDGAELITVFVHDDRWRRAASLPFTEEISRASGSSMNFTLRRAEEVHRDVVVRTQDRLQKLAADSEIQFVFEILTEHEATRFHEFVRSESDLLIAPSFLKGRPFYGELARLKCQILLVDADNVTTETEDL